MSLLTNILKKNSLSFRQQYSTVLTLQCTKSKEKCVTLRTLNSQNRYLSTNQEQNQNQSRPRPRTFSCFPALGTDCIFVLRSHWFGPLFPFTLIVREWAKVERQAELLTLLFWHLLYTHSSPIGNPARRLIAMVARMKIKIFKTIITPINCPLNLLFYSFGRRQFSLTTRRTLSTTPVNKIFSNLRSISLSLTVKEFKIPLTR